MNIVVGSEVFYLQAEGGISRIFRETLPRLRCCHDVDEIFLYTPRGFEGLKQDISGITDKRIGLWLPEGKPAERLKNGINSHLLAPITRYRLSRINNAKYLSSYYGISPCVRPSFCFVHNMTHERFPASFPPKNLNWTLHIKQQAICDADRLLCISKTSMADVIDRYGVDPAICDVVYLGGGEIKAKADCLIERQPGPVRCLYVGDWRSPYKNFQFMLRAIKIWKERSKESLELHVVSKIPMSKSGEEYDSNILGSELFWYECANDTDLAELYRYCDILIYPSYWEGFGIPIVEALSWGCAVVCSDIPVFHEVGGDSINYFNALDVDSFGLALDNAFSEGRIIESVRKRTLRSALFTWDKCAMDMLNSLRKLE